MADREAGRRVLVDPPYTYKWTPGITQETELRCVGSGSSATGSDRSMPWGLAAASADPASGRWTVTNAAGSPDTERGG